MACCVIAMDSVSSNPCATACGWRVQSRRRDDASHRRLIVAGNLSRGLMMRVDQLVLTGASRAPEFRSVLRLAFQFVAIFLGLGLVSSLIIRTGPAVIWKQAQVVGWGFPLIIILGGLSQLIRTSAWRQTITYDIKGLSWSRSIGAQLASAACGQLGLAGKMVGEGLRCASKYSIQPIL
jgi:hypothetical protein